MSQPAALRPFSALRVLDLSTEIARSTTLIQTLEVGADRVATSLR